MITDANFKFDVTPKSITGTADVLATNVYDAGAAKKLFEGFSPKPPLLHCFARCTGGTTPSIRFRFVGADNAALSTNPIIIADTGVISNDDAGVALAANGLVQRVLPLWGQTIAKQFYGPIYLQGGTTPTADVTAVISEATQTWMAAKKAAVP
jgi:hypothetical protein